MLSWALHHWAVAASLLGSVGGAGALSFFFPAQALFAVKWAWDWLSHATFLQVVCLVLGIALAIDHAALIASHHGERAWHQQFDAEHKARNADQKAFAQTTANYRAAALEAQRADAANKVRVEGEQAQISKEQSDDYETRIAAARAQYQRLQRDAAAANPGGAAGAPVPGVPAPSGGPSEATCQAGLPDALTATEQAIQLDELIQWIKRQHLIDPNGKPHG